MTTISPSAEGVLEATVVSLSAKKVLENTTMSPSVQGAPVTTIVPLSTKGALANTTDIPGPPHTSRDLDYQTGTCTCMSVTRLGRTRLKNIPTTNTTIEDKIL